MRDNAVLSAFYFIYLFHMPAFVFVSGYFGKKYIEKGAPQYNKLLGYLLLYLIFKFLIWLENGLLYGTFTKFDLFSTNNASAKSISASDILYAIPSDDIPAMYDRFLFYLCGSQQAHQLQL